MEAKGKREDRHMEETLRQTHNGWSQEETDLLWKEIRAAADEGTPLRGVFERMASTLGRRPNSVRNYYYMQLRDRGGQELRRAAPFELFSDEEIHHLLRKVLMARGQGQSVRSCVTEMSGGDRALMLRYQNKYRALLRKKPELIDQVCRELRQEGLPCPVLSVSIQETPLPGASDGLPSPISDPDARAAWTAIAALARRAQRNDAPQSDRLKVQRDLLLMQLEDLQTAARDVIRECKDFLGCEPEEKQARLSQFCDALSGHLARLESISG